MKRPLLAMCLSVAIVFPVACARPQGTTRADYGRISELRIKYKGDYVFKKKDAALLVYHMTDVPVNDAMIEQMFGEFFFDRRGHMRANTAVRELRLYNAEGKFLYRLRYVWWRGKVMKD